MKYTVIAATFVALIMVSHAKADLSLDDDVAVFKLIDNGLLSDPPFEAMWSHTNPFPGDYELAMNEGKITGASLTIVADDIDEGHVVQIAFRDKTGEYHNLGQLNTMSFSDEGGITIGADAIPGHRTVTTFALDPNWLNGVKVIGAVGSFQLYADEMEEIEYSRLTVTYKPTPIPNAVILGIVGLGLIGWIKRRFT